MWLNSDSNERESYIETTQDAIVHLYYLYERIGENKSTMFLDLLTQAFVLCCDSNDIIGVEATLLLLTTILETVVDVTSHQFVGVLTTIFQKVRQK